MDHALKSNEIKALIRRWARGIGDQFNLDNLRYSKIVIMTDADVDGAHITTLLLTFFFRYMEPLITSGHLFLAQPPLYQITTGKTAQYVYSRRGEGRRRGQAGQRKASACSATRAWAR